MNRGTAAITGHHVVNRRMGGATMFGRGRYRETGAEKNRGGKRNFYFADQFCISWLNFAA